MDNAVNKFSRTSSKSTHSRYVKIKLDNFMVIVSLFRYVSNQAISKYSIANYSWDSGHSFNF